MKIQSNKLFRVPGTAAGPVTGHFFIKSVEAEEGWACGSINK